MSLVVVSRPSADSVVVSEPPPDLFRVLFSDDARATSTVSFLTKNHIGKARTSWIPTASYELPASDELHRVMMHEPILQIKGWGSGMQTNDYGCEPTFAGVRLTESFLELVRKRVENSLPTTKPVWIQWDGDQLTPGTYGYFLIAVAVILFRRKLLSGLICMKLTTPEKMMAEDGHGFVSEFMIKKGGALLRHMCPEVPICLVAYPYEKDPIVKKMQKDTKYGWYGASLNRLFKGHKTIFAFGGGDVLDQEEKHGYDSNTTIVGFEVTRNDGSQNSAFATKSR
jgi:hypothetical protein